MNELLQNVYGQFLDPKQLIIKYQQMEGKKQTWRTKWQRIQDAVFPSFREYTGTAMDKDLPRTEKIANHCSAISGKVGKAVALLHSQLTDPMCKWIGLRLRRVPSRLTSEQYVDLSNNQSVKIWLQSCEDVLYDLFNDPSSNFYPSTYVFHRDWYVLGTACRHVCLRQDTGDIYFNTIGMDEISIDIGTYDQIDCVSRKYNLTAEQAYNLWGESVGAEVLQVLQNPNGRTSNRKFEFIEMCMPTPPEARQNQFAIAEYLSVVIDKAGKNIVSISPEPSFPYIVARYDLDAGELYGKSPVWYAMPDITIINRISKKNVQKIDYSATPPILAADALSLNTAQLSPGAIVQGLDSDNRPTFQPMVMGQELPLAMQFYQEKLLELDEQLMANDIVPPDIRGSMAPTEIIERKIQWNNRIRPIIVRLEREDLQYTLKRTLQLLQIKGELPQFPYFELGLAPDLLPNPIEMIKISFSSPLARMRRLQDMQNIDNLVFKTMQFAQANPEIMTLIKMPEVIREEADILDVPKSIVKTDQELIAEAEMAQQAQEQQQAKVDEEEALQKRVIEGQLEKEGIEEVPEDVL